MTIFHNSYLVYFFSVPKDEQLHLDQSFEILHLFLPIGYSDCDRVSEFRVIGGPKLDLLLRVVHLDLNFLLTASIFVPPLRGPLISNKFESI